MASGTVFTRRAAATCVISAVAGGVVLATRGRGHRSQQGPAHPGQPAHPPAIAAADVPAVRPPPSPTPPPPPQLPRGGREIFPTYRLVGYSGGPGSAAFGRLGTGDIDERAREIESLARTYAGDRRPQPVLELIAVVAQPWPGRDGLYRVRVGPDVVRTYLAAARRHRALLLLNIQPGRARFIDEVRALEPWLIEPDVGVALDPEWAVQAGQVPGRVFGRTSGAEIGSVVDYLAQLVEVHDLPEKALVVHQLRVEIVTGYSALHGRPGVAVVQSVDGIGPPAAKVDTWSRVAAGRPVDVRPGFKLFFDEDRAHGSRLMTPAEVLALRPTPEYVLYE